MGKTLIAIVFIVSASSLCQAQLQSPGSLRPPIPEEEFSSVNQNLILLFRTGNEAFIAGRYDHAIDLYDQGLLLSPNEPALWINKAASLLQQGMVTYNSAVFSGDKVLKRDGFDSARRVFRDAAEAAGKGVTLMNAMTVPGERARPRAFELHRIYALLLRAQALLIVATRIDESYTSTALDALHAYIDAEPEHDRKLEGQNRAGEMLLTVGRLSDALAEYQKTLLAAPENVEATLGAAVVLINLGYLSSDSTYRQQGLDYLSKFVEAAPATHRYKPSAETALAYLKEAERANASVVPGTSLSVEIKEDDPNKPAAVAAAVADPRSGVTTVVGTRPPEIGSAGDSGKRPSNANVLNGRALHLGRPAYPAIAKFARARGTVVVQVTINESGNVISASAISGHSFLRADSVAAARQSRFSPTKLSGQPVKVTGVITYNFVAE